MRGGLRFDAHCMSANCSRSVRRIMEKLSSETNGQDGIALFRHMGIEARMRALEAAGQAREFQI
jgi:hypothetical protein